MDFNGTVLYQVHLSSRSYRFKSFSKTGRWSAITPLSIPSAPPYFSPPPGLPEHKCKIFCYGHMGPWGSIHSFIFYFFVCCSDGIVSFVLVSSSLTWCCCSVPSILLLSPFPKLLFWLCCFSALKVVFGSHIYLLFFFWNLPSFFSFVSNMFIIAHWRIFIMAALKSRVDNSNISVISVLFSIHCSFHFVW